MSSTTKQMFEGVGAPVNVDEIDRSFDPTLDSCCQREVREMRYFLFGACVCVIRSVVHTMPMCRVLCLVKLQNIASRYVLFSMQGIDSLRRSFSVVNIYLEFQSYCYCHC